MFIVFIKCLVLQVCVETIVYIYSGNLDKRKIYTFEPIKPQLHARWFYIKHNLEILIYTVVQIFIKFQIFTKLYIHSILKMLQTFQSKSECLLFQNAVVSNKPNVYFRWIPMLLASFPVRCPWHSHCYSSFSWLLEGHH